MTFINKKAALMPFRTRCLIALATVGATGFLGGCIVVPPRGHIRPVVVEPYRAPVVVEPYRVPRRYGYDRY